MEFVSIVTSLVVWIVLMMEFLAKHVMKNRISFLRKENVNHATLQAVWIALITPVAKYVVQKTTFFCKTILASNVKYKAVLFV